MLSNKLRQTLILQLRFQAQNKRPNYISFKVLIIIIVNEFKDGGKAYLLID